MRRQADSGGGGLLRRRRCFWFRQWRIGDQALKQATHGAAWFLAVFHPGHARAVNAEIFGKLKLVPAALFPDGLDVEFGIHSPSVHNAHQSVKAKRTPVPVQNAPMKNPDKSKSQGERLAEARRARGFETAKDAAKYFGWPYATYSQHERGERGLRKDAAETYAKNLRVSPSWLMLGEGTMKSQNGPEEIPIYGKAGAREVVNLIESDDHTPIDTVTPLRAEDGFHAVIVDGSSMLPTYRDGDFLFFRRSGEITESIIGRDCIVITDKARVYVKRVTKGSGKGKYDLLSYAPEIDPIKDVRLKSAWPVEWIRRK